MSSAKDLREARRRKILERGGDRLAYITGQVKVLPPVEPVASPPPGESGLKSLSIAGELPSSTEDLLPTISPSCDTDEISKKLTRVRDELQSLDSATNESTPLLTTPEETTPLLPPSASTLSTQQQEDIALPPATTSKTRSSFNYAALVKSIEQSLVVRAVLAFLIGVALVTQWTYSKCQHSLESQNYILSWPVFLVVITDVTVVLGALLLGLVKVSSVADKEKLDRGGLAGLDQMLAFTSQLEGALDLGLLVAKASSGLISDISLYLVTVICAVSLAQQFQPALCTFISR